jgi:hypothetical protein
MPQDSKTALRVPSREVEDCAKLVNEEPMTKRLQIRAIAAAVAATLATAPVAHVATNGMRESRRFASKGSVSGNRRGRPRKFSRPSRGVTLTLPEDVIEALRTVDSDLSVAVVRIAQSLVPDAPYVPAELVNYGGRSVIIVPRSQVLRQRTGVELVPLTDGRALMAFDNKLSIPQLELRIGDALADASIEGDDRAMFEALAEILKNARRSERVEVRQRNIIVLQSTRPVGEDGSAREEGDEEPQVASA